jgi:CubicO group peptidase (beta-lactamase class C family)
MALVIFTGTYLTAAGTFWLVAALARRGLAPAFKSVSPGLLSPVGPMLVSLARAVLVLSGCAACWSPSVAQAPVDPGATPAATPALDAAGVDLPAYVERARNAFNVPGIAVAVVKDGRSVFEQGFGVRNVSDGKPVGPHTMFCIASNTKSFTATAIEMLADQGRLHLDDRVLDHLPWFRMADPYVTAEMRIRDTLAHRSGLGNHAGDLLFVPSSTYSTKEVVGRLRDLPLATGFRSAFAYENIMYAVATLIIETASGQSYADFVRDRMFQPIGMTESRVDSTYLKADDDVATAYMPRDDGGLMAVPPLAWKNSQGAAGIYSSVHDMAKWVEVQLAGGALPDDGDSHPRRLFSSESQQRMWSMITPIDIEPAEDPRLQPAQPDFFGYAEGWYLSDYRGQRTVWHSGGFPGTVSLVTLVPALHLGVVVLTNQEAEGALGAITFRVLDAYLHAPDTDWIGAYAASARLEQTRRAAQDAERAAERDANARPSQALANYAGTYRDPWYGAVKVWLEAGQLRIRFTKSPRLVGSLSAWGKDTFLVRWDDRTLNADALIDFRLGSGKIIGASMRRASARTAHAYDFQDLHLAR